MWFIFPPWKGLGHSSIANLYAITSRREAEANLTHPVLGPRLMDSAGERTEGPYRRANLWVSGRFEIPILDDFVRELGHQQCTLSGSINEIL
jgi:uncharacterized protein (DUF1810 family)